MAFPVIATTNTYSDAVGGTSHAVNLPTGISVGDLLLIFMSINNGSTITDPSGWVVLESHLNNDDHRIYARIADGSEGSTVTVTLNTTKMASAVSYRITGGRNGTSSSEIAVSSAVDASTTTPDPPNLAPSWGSDDNLWIALTLASDGNWTLSSYPTNYTLGQQNVQTDSGAGNSVTVAARNLTASSEDPGVFTCITSRTRSSYTLAIRPAPPSASFGWFEQGNLVAPPPPRVPNYNSYNRDLRPGINFTTPTPTNLEWFAPYSKLPVVGKAPTPSSFALVPVKTTTPPFGWFAPYAMPELVSAKGVSSIAMDPQAISAPSSLTSIGWFEPYSKSVPFAKPPVSSIARAPQPPTPTLTTDIGWFEPYAQRGAKAKEGSSSIAMDPQPIAAPQTLTTDIGWFEPYAQRGAKAKEGSSSIAMDPQPIAAPQTLTTDIGWFEPYAKLPVVIKAPASSIVGGPRYSVSVQFGWFEPYALRASARKTPTSSVAMDPQAVVAPTLTTSIGWFAPYAKLPSFGKIPKSSTVNVFQFTPALPVVPQAGAILLCGL